MGADGSAYVVYGFRVTRGQFFEAGVEKVRCASGHVPGLKGHTFCPKCGSKFTGRSEEIATPSFRKFAANLADVSTPERCWDGLQEGLIYPKDRDYAGLGLHRVGAVESNEPSPSGHLAMGFKILDQDGEGSRNNSRTCSKGSEEVERTLRWLPQVAEDLGVKDPKFELFLTFYWSI